MRKDIKQIKTINGDELICEVLDVLEDEYGDAMVVKNCLSIVCEEDRKREIRWYTFRPFMLHQDADQQLVLNTTNVLCITNPSRGVLDYFQTYVENYRTIKNESEDFVSENMDVTFSDGDSDLDNLIRFPGSRPDKLH